MGVVYGGYITPPEPPVIWAGLDMKWIGWDGSVWSLSDSSNGTVMLPGVRGMSMPPIIHHRAAHASVPGARWRGNSVDVREVFWPLQVYTNRGSQEWLKIDNAFWRTMDPTRTGTWQVVQPDGTTRSLRLRFVDDGEMTFGTDPAMVGWSTYGITMAAEQPYWEGAARAGLWLAGTQVPFFGASGSPAFTISPSNTLADAKFTNPGDVDAYLTWRIYGPVTTATVGINGRNITIPFSIPDGEVLQIETHPTRQIALLGPAGVGVDADGMVTAEDGSKVPFSFYAVDKTNDLGMIDFAPLPARKENSLSLTMSGLGSVMATFTPLYYRAW